jgi:hypothetical protein
MAEFSYNGKATKVMVGTLSNPMLDTDARRALLR